MNKYLQLITDDITYNSLRLVMFHAYLNNKSDFMNILGAEIVSNFSEDSFLQDFGGDDDMFEVISKLSSSIIKKTHNYKLVSNGMFTSLQFAKPKKKKASLLEIYDFFYQFALGPWSI